MEIKSKRKNKPNKPKLLANLGDEHPMDYGGFFVYENGDCVKLEEPCEDYSKRNGGEPEAWTAYRFCAEKCTYQNGVLSDNEFHPDYPVWFSVKDPERPQDTTGLINIAEPIGLTVEEMAAMFCSNDVLTRAQAWREVGEYWGFQELDSYPEAYTRGQVYRYFRKECYWRFRNGGSK